MVQITERASSELRRLLTDHFARPRQGVRLRLNQAGGLAMTIDIYLESGKKRTLAGRWNGRGGPRRVAARIACELLGLARLTRRAVLRSYFLRARQRRNPL